MSVAIRSIAFVLVVSLAACGPSRGADSTSSATRDSGAVPASSATRTATAGAVASSRAWAATGDTVWVLSNHVKADKRAQFEEFFDAFFAAGHKPGALDSAAAATFVHTRVLTPTTPSHDGTYNYLIIMDPMISGASYEIDPLLRRLFPAAEAERLAKLLESSMARPQESMTLIQRLPR